MAMWWQCEATCAHELVHHHLFLKFTNLFWNSTFWHTPFRHHWLSKFIGWQGVKVKILSLWINCHQFLPSVFPRRSNGADYSGQNCLFLQMLPLPFFSLSPRIAAAATFLCFNIRLSLNCTSLCVTLSLWLYITVSVCRAASWPHLITNRFQPRPALPHTAGGRRGSLRDG